jgi:hypothetical protein
MSPMNTVSVSLVLEVHDLLSAFIEISVEKDQLLRKDKHRSIISPLFSQCWHLLQYLACHRAFQD